MYFSRICSFARQTCLYSPDRSDGLSDVFCPRPPGLSVVLSDVFALSFRFFRQYDVLIWAQHLFCLLFSGKFSSAYPDFRRQYFFRIHRLLLRQHSVPPEAQTHQLPLRNFCCRSVRSSACLFHPLPADGRSGRPFSEPKYRQSHAVLRWHAALSAAAIHIAAS